MTMCIANVLPDRSAGFVATDTRCVEPGPTVVRYADCGGKIVQTPFGWGAATGNDGPRVRELLLQLRDTPIDPTETSTLARLDRIVQSAFRKAELTPRRIPLEDSLSNAIALDATVSGVFLSGSSDGRAAEDEFLHVAAPVGEVQSAQVRIQIDARQQAIADEVMCAPADLVARIRIAARWFSLGARDSRVVSNHLDVGFLIRAPDGLMRMAFLSGRSSEMASGSPDDIVRFLAPYPTLTPSEILRRRVQQGLPPYLEFA